MTAKTDPEMPAFPRTYSHEGHNGMLLRDYFAAKAMQGLLSNSGGPVQRSEQSGWALTNCNYNDVATVAYMMADAMLIEKDKP